MRSCTWGRRLPVEGPRVAEKGAIVCRRPRIIIERVVERRQVRQHVPISAKRGDLASMA